jgi:hypothetical protein
MWEESSAFLLSNEPYSPMSLIASYVKVIDLLTGQPGKRARHPFHSVTKEVTAIRVLDHEKYGRHIVLVDTPGFYQERSDKEILEIISAWLLRTFVGFSLFD